MRVTPQRGGARKVPRSHPLKHTAGKRASKLLFKILLAESYLLYMSIKRT